MSLNRIKNWLLKNLLNAIVIEDIITYDKVGQIYINRVLITDAELNSIAEEIKFLKSTRFWALMNSTLADEAKLRLFNHSKTIEDMHFGKAMLYNLDIMSKAIKILEDTARTREKTRKELKDRKKLAESLNKI